MRGLFPGTWTGYEYGLQTVGSDENGDPVLFLDPETLEAVNRSGFMAYAVQVEEDRLNREILAMHREAARDEIRNQVGYALEYGDIRERDDWLTRKADAQAGRVLKDREGNWVRVQQYVLRPDESTVQVLNVCLRDGGDQAGFFLPGLADEVHRVCGRPGPQDPALERVAGHPGGRKRPVRADRQRGPRARGYVRGAEKPFGRVPEGGPVVR